MTEGGPRQRRERQRSNDRGCEHFALVANHRLLKAFHVMRAGRHRTGGAVVPFGQTLADSCRPMVNRCWRAPSRWSKRRCASTCRRSAYSASSAA